MDPLLPKDPELQLDNLYTAPGENAAAKKMHQSLATVAIFYLGQLLWAWSRAYTVEQGIPGHSPWFYVLVSSNGNFSLLLLLLAAIPLLLRGKALGWVFLLVFPLCRLARLAYAQELT